jgi:hypothetical protein
MSTTASPWASTDHDPTSLTEDGIADPKTVTVQSISGNVLAEYPNFTHGQPVRILPGIVSSSFPTEGSVVDDSWSFVGPTRHPEYATIRHDIDNVTTAIERRRIQHRPTS